MLGEERTAPGVVGLRGRLGQGRTRRGLVLRLAFRGVPGEVVEEPVLFDPAEMGGCTILNHPTLIVIIIHRPQRF